MTFRVRRHDRDLGRSPDRLLQGTDRPRPDLTVMPDEGRPLDLHAEFAPDAISRNRIFVDNLLVLL